MLCAAYPGGGTMGTGYTSGWRWFGDGKQQGCNLNLQAVVPARVMAHTFNGDNKATSLAPSYSNGRFSEKLPSLRTCYGVCPCEGFRMTAPSRDWPRALGPSSESLQGRNPREVGGNGAARSMGISTQLLRMRLLMRLPAERWRSRTVVATRLGSPGKRRPTPIRALRGRLDTRSDER
jgi:hypothetical protein